MDTILSQHDFQAAKSWLEQHKKDLPLAVWHYQMGVVYASSKNKINNYALARYHFLSAKNEGHLSKPLLRNLKVVENQLQIEKWERRDSWSDYLVTTSLFSTQVLFPFLSLLIVLFIVFKSVQDVWKKRKFKKRITLLFVALSMTGLQLWVSSWDQFVTVEKSELFDGPSELFSTNNEVPPGVHVIGQQKKGWIKILYPSRFQGWIFKNNKVKVLGD